MRLHKRVVLSVSLGPASYDISIGEVEQFDIDLSYKIQTNRE